MYEYQKDKRFFAQVTGLMENLCEDELKELGAKNTKITYRGVYFETDQSTLYKINYTSRLVTRVLAPLIIFPCYNTDVLRKRSKRINWEDFLSVDKTFSISASTTKSKITNSLFASQCLKDGIADYFREKFGKRPNVNVKNPDVRFNLHIEKDTAIISLDTSGESLHKRGYRLLAGEAPMQETLAAALIKISKWDGSTPLLDCMCGSGTIICEALMHYCNIPAQTLRNNFGFFHMKEFDTKEWEKVKSECDKNIRPLPKGIIFGNDISKENLSVASSNLSRLPYSNSIELTNMPFQKIDEFKNGTIICNPPYGMRLGKSEGVKVLYKEFGDFLKGKCGGTTAYIYTGEPSLRKSIGLKSNKLVSLFNGKLEGILLQIESYEGSKKKKYQNSSEE